MIVRFQCFVHLIFSEVVCVDSGKKALEELRNSKEKYHLVLSDIHMPGT